MIIDCAVYRDGRRRPGPLELSETFEAARQPGAFAWIGLHEPSEDEFDTVREEFHLHPLAVEDAVQAHQRPKVEVYPDSLFVVLKTARYLDLTETVEFAEILLFVGDHFIVSVRHGEASALAEVRKAVEGEPELMRCGPGAVLHAVVDRVVDDYAPVIAGIDNDIREVEAEVFSDERTNVAERIYKLKREVLDFDRHTEPLLEPLSRLAAGTLPYCHSDLGNYFRDVEDHLRRVVSAVGHQRDLLTDALDANLAQVNVRQSEDMRTISAWVALAAIPTMFAGIWGMNFEHMPELDARLGYPLAIAVMVTCCALLYRRLKRAGWL